MCHFLLGLIWGSVWACWYFKRLKMYTRLCLPTWGTVTSRAFRAHILLAFQVTPESLGKGPSRSVSCCDDAHTATTERQKEKPDQLSVLVSWSEHLTPHQIKPRVFILARCRSLFVFNEMICGVRLPFGFNINILLELRGRRLFSVVNNGLTGDFFFL